MAYFAKHKKGGSSYVPSFDSDNKPLGLRQYTHFSDGGFALNEYGYIRNDISALLSVQNELSFARALQRFKSQQIESKSSFADLSHDEMIKQLRPRWCQLPYQQRAFAEYLTEEKASEIASEIERLRQQYDQSVSSTASKVESPSASSSSSETPATT